MDHRHFVLLLGTTGYHGGSLKFLKITVLFCALTSRKSPPKRIVERSISQTQDLMFIHIYVILKVEFKRAPSGSRILIIFLVHCKIISHFCAAICETQKVPITAKFWKVHQSHSFHRVLGRLSWTGWAAFGEGPGFRDYVDHVRLRLVLFLSLVSGDFLAFPMGVHGFCGPTCN